MRLQASNSKQYKQQSIAHVSTVSLSNQRKHYWCLLCLGAGICVWNAWDVWWLIGFFCPLSRISNAYLPLPVAAMHKPHSFSKQLKQGCCCCCCCFDLLCAAACVCVCVCVWPCLFCRSCALALPHLSMQLRYRCDNRAMR